MKTKSQRGFSCLTEHLKKHTGAAKYLRDCTTCAYNKGEDEVDCSNPSVLPYDMTKDDDGKQYCAFWNFGGDK